MVLVIFVLTNVLRKGSYIIDDQEKKNQIFEGVFFAKYILPWIIFSKTKTKKMCK